MPNRPLVLFDYEVLALATFGAIAVDLLADAKVGDVFDVLAAERIGEYTYYPFDVAVVDVTDTATWLRAVPCEVV